MFPSSFFQYQIGSSFTFCNCFFFLSDSKTDPNPQTTRYHFVFFFVLLISSLLSYKSQSALLQLCLLFSGVLIFFLLSSYPSRLIKKGLLLILL
ncbi:hypothetical protein LEP1GSC151_3446 [Leptospira interrogans serovar Grippotyphosa str. LT2186]|uniref:Uncharacterized protein n=1 Tax=Leptospira interrogans serovar Grippotyphosa str. LT2186 TaxID=1001599 RepID=M3HL04_LEPIR|nr:hypothetical protein LEP1GSC151_3446 [Leptospira interrogans serovar Grippotyphosa str. LT2186]